MRWARRVGVGFVVAVLAAITVPAPLRVDVGSAREPTALGARRDALPPSQPAVEVPTTSSSEPPTTTAGASTTTTAEPAPVGRPAPEWFGVGVQADTGTLAGWMPKTGVPWSYAYRYIGGGMNRGGATNWTEWEPNATYPITFAAAAASRGYTPVFSHYSITAAVGPCARAERMCSEAETDLTNLNSPAVMRLYYDDFARLMQRLGPGTWDGVAGYGEDVVVHVEPDLSGYAQTAVLRRASCFGFCTGVGNDPSLLQASVSSSGHPDVAELSDTYVGFNQALLRLRDLYAPNVRLAFHISNWSTLHDLNSATSPFLDATALGTDAGEFAAASGVAPLPGSASTYDLVFNDVSNKDAGYYTHVLLKPRFWDRDNVVFPNFHRWEEYVRAFTVVTQRPVVVWQVPMGNQWFRTMNNTPNHYQDNRVEYFFAHIDELQAVGIVGLLFGKTTDMATHFWDAAGDGITNPPPLCTSDGTSSGQICNDHRSVHPDDDGGYLRISARQYYEAPVPVTPLPR